MGNRPGDLYNLLTVVEEQGALLNMNILNFFKRIAGQLRQRKIIKNHEKLHAQLSADVLKKREQKIRFFIPKDVWPGELSRNDEKIRFFIEKSQWPAKKPLTWLTTSNQEAPRTADAYKFGAPWKISQKSDLFDSLPNGNLEPKHRGCLNETGEIG